MSVRWHVVSVNIPPFSLTMYYIIIPWWKSCPGFWSRSCTRWYRALPIKDPRQDPKETLRIVMMLYNLAQDPGKSWTRLLSLTPYPPFPCYHKKITGRHRTLAAQIWAKFLNWTLGTRHSVHKVLRVVSLRLEAGIAWSLVTFGWRNVHY